MLRCPSILGLHPLNRSSPLIMRKRFEELAWIFPRSVLVEFTIELCRDKLNEIINFIERRAQAKLVVDNCSKKSLVTFLFRYHFQGDLR